MRTFKRPKTHVYMGPPEARLRKATEQLREEDVFKAMAAVPESHRIIGFAAIRPFLKFTPSEALEEFVRGGKKEQVEVTPGN